MNLRLLESVDSTNNYAKANAASLPSPTMVVAREQTAGRGQRGNSWESEPGANLTFSVFVRLPGFPARRQFAVSEAVALAVADTLGVFGVQAKVKWPNDIYVGDRKICGILIEHALMGAELMHTVIGAGINVNQKRFLSPAPNPVSMRQLLGKETPVVAVREKVAARLEAAFLRLGDEEGRLGVHREFLRRLWRGDGNAYPFRDASTGEVFKAVIAGIDPDGPLRLRLADGEEREYLFKQVEFLL